MRTIVYELQGKDVPEALRGAKINIAVGENYRECETLTEKGESDVCAKFNDGRVIALQGALRTKSKKSNLAELQSFADGYKYTERVEGEGGPSAPKTARGVATQKAAASGNRLFEKCATDETFLQRMVKQQIVDLDEFNAWKQARDLAAKDPKAKMPEAATA